MNFLYIFRNVRGLHIYAFLFFLISAGAFSYLIVTTTGFLAVILTLLILIIGMLFMVVSVDIEQGSFTNEFKKISIWRDIKRHKTKENIIKHIIENPENIKYVPKKYKTIEVILAEKLQ